MHHTVDSQASQPKKSRITHQEKQLEFQYFLIHIRKIPMRYIDHYQSNFAPVMTKIYSFYLIGKLNAY